MCIARCRRSGSWTNKHDTTHDPNESFPTATHLRGNALYLAAQHGDDLVEHPHSLPFPGLVNPRRLKPLEQPKDPGVYDDDEAGDEGGADGPLALDAIDDMDYEQLERELAALEEGEGGEGGEHDPKKKKKKAKKSSGGRKKKKVLPASDDEI